MLRLLSLGMRAVQVLAAAGVASKRACEALMTEGAVEVNGVRLGTRDGAAITGEARLEVKALEDAEVVLVDAA